MELTKKQVGFVVAFFTILVILYTIGIKYIFDSAAYTQAQAFNSVQNIIDQTQNDFNKDMVKVNTMSNSYLLNVEKDGMLTDIDKAAINHKIADLGYAAVVSGTAKKALSGDKVFLDIQVKSQNLYGGTIFEKDIYKTGLSVCTN